jgi:RNA polymerase sigma-70 factor (ECF subfamily)
MDNTDDQLIINRVLQGEVNAFGILVKRYQKPIFNLMYRIVGSADQAADLAQETFIKAYENLEKFAPGKRFFPWLYAVGLNHAKDFIRKNKARQKTELNTERMIDSQQFYQQQEHLCETLDFQRVEKALSTMPLTYREAVILRYHEELSTRDISTALQISPSAAKMRISRGLEMLRQILKGGDYEG